VFGTIEPIDAKATANAASAYNLIVMTYPDGRAPARYRRTHPNGPWIYTGGQSWEFQYVAGDDFPVFDTVHGKVGLAMCSEVYMPEVTRALALRGAELIFMPAGVDKNRLWATWRTLIWARAIENLAIVVTTQNLFDHGQRGLAMVAAPEEILFESTVAGLSIVDVSLDRVRQLRSSRDEVGSSASCAAKQGVLGPQWQRPELYDAFYPRPLREAAE
jgi:predicted amidohydrolase